MKRLLSLAAAALVLAGCSALHHDQGNPYEKPLFIETLREIADGPIFLEAGAQLIRDKTGEIIGCLGVTGDVNEVDDICALAGIRAAGFKTDEDFSPEDVRRLNIKLWPKIVDPRGR